MSSPSEMSLIIKKHTIYDKIRTGLFALIFQKDYKMIQRLDELIVPKRPIPKNIVIPREVGKQVRKY